MEEVEYLRAGSTLVTSTRVEIDGQTFAMRNVGSVKVTKPGAPIFGAFLVLVGLVMAFQAKGNDNQMAMGIALAVGASIWVWQKLRQRSLVIVTGGGEVVALKSLDGAAVEKLRAAIAQAISGR